jgi:thiamine-monophosphate kinase
LPRIRGCSIAEAINDGEDYELLFALPPNDAPALEKKWRKQFPHLLLSRIGSFLPPSALRLPPSFHGYVHFQ